MGDNPAAVTGGSDRAPSVLSVLFTIYIRIGSMRRRF